MTSLFVTSLNFDCCLEIFISRLIKGNKASDLDRSTNAESAERTSETVKAQSLRVTPHLPDLAPRRRWLLQA